MIGLLLGSSVGVLLGPILCVEPLGVVLGGLLGSDEGRLLGMPVGESLNGTLGKLLRSSLGDDVGSALGGVIDGVVDGDLVGGIPGMADSEDVGERDRSMDEVDDGSGDTIICDTVGASVGMTVTIWASTTVPIVAS